MHGRGLASAGAVVPQDRWEGEAAEGWKKVGAAVQCRVRRSRQGTGSREQQGHLGPCRHLVTD